MRLTCTARCLVRLAFCVKLCPHPGSLQTKGRSPVCTLRWSKKLCHFLKNILQPSWSHFKILTYLIVLGFLYLKIRNFLVEGISSSILIVLKLKFLPYWTKSSALSGIWLRTSSSETSSLSIRESSFSSYSINSYCLARFYGIYWSESNYCWSLS